MNTADLSPRSVVSTSQSITERLSPSGRHSPSGRRSPSLSLRSRSPSPTSMFATTPAQHDDPVMAASMKLSTALELVEPKDTLHQLMHGKGRGVDEHRCTACGIERSRVLLALEYEAELEASPLALSRDEASLVLLGREHRALVLYGGRLRTGGLAPPEPIGASAEHDWKPLPTRPAPPAPAVSTTVAVEPVGGAAPPPRAAHASAVLDERRSLLAISGGEVRRPSRPVAAAGLPPLRLLPTAGADAFRA